MTLTYEYGKMENSTTKEIKCFVTNTARGKLPPFLLLFLRWLQPAVPLAPFLCTNTSSQTR
jgi:hypothetical protein